MGTISPVEKLSKAIGFPTVSYQEKNRIDYGIFEGFIGFLRSTFPALHGKLEQELINRYTLLYRWKGSKSGAGKKPLLLMAHYDVVPASEKDWRHTPFGGEVAEGQIWGRGSLDNKSSLIGILEATERLIVKGFEPARDIYILSGHDEETSGYQGSRVAVSLLEKRGVKIETIVDEGLTIVEPDIMPLFKRPMALVGIAEKGIMDVTVTARGFSGHASMPPRSTAIGLLSRAITRIEENPFPGRITDVIRLFLKKMGREAGGVKGMILRYPVLFGPLIKRVFSLSPVSDAMIRTTQAVTMLKGGEKENILPPSASANINIRILPGDSIEGVLKRYRRLISAMGVRVEAVGDIPPSEPVSESDVNSLDYLALEDTIREVYPDVGVAPFLVLATTDSRHFRGKANNIYRFVPLWMTGEKLQTVHGTNERIGVDEFLKLIYFYEKLIERAGNLKG